MRRVFGRTVLASLLCGVVASAPATAQVQGYMNTPVSSFLGDQLRYNQMLLNFKHDVGSSSSQHAKYVDPLPTRPPFVNVTDSTFNPVTHFTPGGPSTVPHDLAAQSGGDAAKRAQVAAFYRSLLQNFDEELTAQHEARRRNDLAGAYTTAIQEAYYVTTGGREIGDASENGLLAQFSTMISNSPARAMTDAQKQLMYDRVVILGGMVVELTRFANAHHDAKMAANMKSVSEQLLTAILGGPSSSLRFSPLGVTRS